MFPDIDDPYYAGIVIDSIPVKSYLRDFKEHANLEDLEQFIWHQEEPLQNSSIFGSWQLYKFIKEMGVTVVLDGQGADELIGVTTQSYSEIFAGYFKKLWI